MARFLLKIRTAAVTPCAAAKNAGVIMSISGLSVYAGNSHYQWQTTQNTSSSSSGSRTQNALSGLTSPYTSMTSQISGMVELVQYAMDAMGLSGDSRVTFSQITKYQQQIEKEFDASLKEALEASSLSDIAGLTFTLSKDGKLTAAGGTDEDTKKAQSYLNEHPELAEKLVQSLKDAGLELTENLKFTLSSTGEFTLASGSTHDVQSLLDEQTELVDGLRDGLAGSNVDLDGLSLVFDDAGNLVAADDNPQAYDINNWLRQHSELETLLKKTLDEKGIALSDVSLSLPQGGGMSIDIASDNSEEVRQALRDQKELGKELYDGLAGLGIDPDITFSLQVESDGSVTINSSHPDADKLRQLFADTPELTKQYAQVQALSGIEDARAALQIEPSAMRTRLQMETIASSWFSSQSTSSFGTYSSTSGLSLLAGLDLNI